MTLIMEPSKEIQLLLLEDEVGKINNTRKLLEMRYNVNKRLGQTPEELKPITDDLLKIEQLLKEWEVEKERVLSLKE